MGSREGRSGKPRIKKKVSGSSTERRGPDIFIPISACAGDRLGAEYLKELGAPAGLGFIGAHFDDHLQTPFK
jgi:hypothetical protein